MRDMDDRGWGRRYLMCRPDHFTVEYAINPWMTPDDPVDRRPFQVFNDVSEVLDAVGGVVEPRPGLVTHLDRVLQTKVL